MKNNGKRYKKNSGAKKAIAFILVLLLCVAVVGVCLQFFGQGKLKPSEWFKFDKQAEKTADDDNSEKQEVAQSALALSVAPFNAAADSIKSANSYTVTATVSPENATNKQLYWSLRWKYTDDGKSGYWGAGKTIEDYVLLDVQTDTSATVSVTNPFGEQIILTCWWAVDSNVNTSITLDYGQRVTTLSVTSSPATLSLDSTFTLSGSPQSTAYTVESDFDFSEVPTYSVSIIVNDEFYSKLVDYYGFYPASGFFPVPLTVNGITATESGFSKTLTFNEDFLNKLFGKTCLTERNNREALAAACSSLDISPLVVSATATYSNGLRVRGNCTLDFEGSRIRSYVPVSSITSDSGSVVF